MEEKKISKEIDIVALVLKVFKEWRLLLKFLGVFGVIGTVIALNTPKYFTTEVILAPEMATGGGGIADNISNVASSFGIDIGNKSSMDAIYPEIYPDIFASTDFCANLFDVPVCTKDDPTPRTYKQHLSHDLKIPFWDIPMIKFKKWMQEMKKEGQGGGKANPLVLSKNDYMLCLAIKEQILCVIDKKTSEITISVTDQDAMTSAIMADTVMTRLQSYITDYRTRKARIDYNYYTEMAAQALRTYNIKADAYNNFGDSHRNSILTSTSTKENTLLEDMENAYQVYTGMNKMREQSMAKIQERTPAFTVIQSAKMPYKPSSRPKIFTLFIYLILGGIFDALWILFGRDFYNKRKQTKTEEQ